MTANQFTILYFAAAGSVTRKAQEQLEAPMSVQKLFDLLEHKYPGIKTKVLASSAVTINLDYIDLDQGDASDLIIHEGDEVALIPPVSSG